MKFEIKLAWKYFRARRKSLARLTAAAAIVGIAVGVASLIAAQSLAYGFQDEMRDKILANTPHISVISPDATEISNWREIKSNLENTENIETIVPTAFENALIIGETQTSYAVLKVQDQTAGGNSGAEDLTGSKVAVGARLAEKLNLKIGDAAEILTLDNQTPTRARIAEIFETGLYDYDSTWIRVSPEFFAHLHGRQIFTPVVLSISVGDIYRTDETAAEIRAKLGENFKVVDWQEANRPLFAALSLERKVSLAIISLIVLISALNITTTLALLVGERQLDIAILRTCGATPKNILIIFLFEGFILGLIGVFCGVILGLSVCAAGSYFKIINLSAEVYALSSVPFHPRLLNIILIVVTAFALCLTAALYPAFRASRVKPLENLRRR